MTMTLSKQDIEQDTVLFLESDLTHQEWTERQADEMAIELAGKDRLEKALIIGEKLSHIYNSGTFRRSAPGGQRWSWEDWVTKRLPEILPEATGHNWADDRRWLHEVRSCLSIVCDRSELPTTGMAARTLVALIPRRYTAQAAKWNPSVLDDPQRVEGLQAVWKLAQQNAVKQQRKNGPTTEDVRNAREELRPQLMALGLIREASSGLKQGLAERMAAAASKRQQVIELSPEEKASQEAATQAVLHSIRAEAPARHAQASVDAVKEELAKSDREQQERLQKKVRDYNSKLNSASVAVHELLVFLRSVDRIDGTQYLDEMRATDVLGLITVEDDMTRLQAMGTDLMEAVNLARSSNPPTGIDMTTVQV
jgi:hypothetical protein